MKKSLSLILVVCMLIGMLPSIALAAESENNITVRYDISEVMKDNGYKSSTTAERYNFMQYDFERTNGFFRFVSASEGNFPNGASLNYRQSNVGTEENPIYKTVVQLGKNRTIAFEVYIPAAGTYTMNMYNGLRYSSGGSVDVFMNKEVSASAGKVGNYNSTGTAETVDWFPVSTPNVISGIEVPEAGYYIFTFKAVDGYGSVGTFELVSGDGSGVAVMAPVLSLSKDKVTVGGTADITASVFDSAGNAVNNAELSYKSLTESTATVDNNGKITATGAGQIEIEVTATYDGYSAKSVCSLVSRSMNASGYRAVYDFARDHEYKTDVTTLTYADNENFWEFLDQNGDKVHQINPSYGIHSMTTGASHWLAIKINVPAAGEYEMTLGHALRTKGCLGSVYVIPGVPDDVGEALAGIDAPNATVQYEGEDKNDATTYIGVVTLAKGDNTVVFKPVSKGSENCYMFAGKIILEGGEKTALMDVSLSVDNGRASLTGVMSDESAADLSKATISFESSDESVASISQSGKITDNALGTTKITATVEYDSAIFTKSADYEVTTAPLDYSGVDVVYDFMTTKETWTYEHGINAGYTDASPDYIRDIRGITYEHTLGNWEWRGTGNEKGWKTWATLPGSTIRYYDGTGIYARLRANNQYMAFNIKVPAPGKYSVRFDHMIREGDSDNVAMYILPGNTANEDIYSSLTEETLLSEISYATVGENSTIEENLGNITFNEAGEYILVFLQKNVSSGEYYRYKTLSLDGVNCIKAAEATITKNELLYGETAQISVSGTLLSGATAEPDTLEVSYSSNFADIANVDENGVVTAVGDGECIITVTISDGYGKVTEEIPVKAIDNTPIVSTELRIFPTIFVRGAEKLDWRVRMESGNILKVPFDTVSYSYSEEGIVSADEYGKVTALAPGEVVITLSADFHGTTITDSVSVTVKEGEGKSASTYYTDEKKENAKRNIEKYSWAKDAKKSAIKSADKWVANVDVIYDNIMGEGLPRANHIGYLNDPEFQCCKWCGKNVEVGFGGWTMDIINRPWQLQCPNCKRFFPSNDFKTLYERGLDEHGYYDRDRAIAKNAEAVENGEKDALKNVLYPELDAGINMGRGLRPGETAETWGVDDGYGYIPKDENGEPYRYDENNVIENHAYIAYYVRNSYALYQTILSDLTAAYNYTGDIKYGRAGAIITDRIADFYPSFNQSEYWKKQYPVSDGGSGLGHIVGRIADAGTSTNIILATDAFFPALTDPTTIRYLEEKAVKYNLENDKSSALKIWENWDKNILDQAFEFVKKGNIMGNYGLYQQTVATAAIVKDSEPKTLEMIEWIFAKDDLDTEDNPEGGDFTSRMVDVVDRDGMGNETAPNYNGMWLGRLNGMADALMHYTGEKQYNPYDHSKFVAMCLAFTPMVTVNNQTANVGDGTGMLELFIECKETAFMAFFKQVEDPDIKKRLAEFLYINYGGNFNGMHYSIYDEDPESFGREIKEITGDKLPVFPSEILTGYGFSIIRAGEQYLSSDKSTENNNMRDFWLYFGKNYGHAHENTLQLGMEAYGINVAPDPGAPTLKGTDAVRLQWVNQSIAHNTVTVGIKGETDQQVGDPLHFDDSGRVKVMDVDSPYAYEDTDIYRRTIVMVEVDDDTSYGVDFFRVKGGDKHTYSFHSQAENAYVIEGLEMTEQKDADGNWKGSYADENWPVGQDPNSPETWYYDTVYPRGYSWMGKVRRDTTPANKFSIEYDVEDYNDSVEGGDSVVLRLTQVTDFTPTEVALVAGPIPERGDTLKLPATMDYLLVQHEGEDLDSLFTTVLEPYRENNRYLKDINPVEVTVKDGNEGEDDIVSAVRVDHANGRVDYVVHATNTSVTYNVGGVFDFRGAIGVYSLNESGAVIYRYVNDGDIIGTETNAPARYTGKIVDFQRDLSLDNYIDIELSGVETDELIGKCIYVDNDGYENGVYQIDKAENIGNGVMRLDIGTSTPIRSHRVAEDPDRGYIYNILPNQTFSIPVSYIDDVAPVFDAVREDLSASAEKSITIQLHAASESGDVKYVGTTLPRGASIDEDTGKISWKPAGSQTGKNHFAVSAIDSEGRTTTVHFYVTVYGSTSGGGGGGASTPATPNIPSAPDTGDKEDTTKPDTGDKEDTTTPNVPTIPSTDSDTRFVDLGGYAWAEDAINALADDGIIKGTSATTFSPASNITRADFAILLVRAFKLESENEENFADVNANDYFAKELAVARNTGIVGGIGDNKYAPRNTITRQDMMVIVYRVLEKMGKISVGEDIILPQNADFVTVSDYAKEAVSALISAGLVNGKNGNIAPKDYTTRAEVAVLLKRVIDYKNR